MHNSLKPSAKVLILIAVLAALAGCQSIKYRTLEVFGVEKRDILSSNIKSARDAQGEAKEEFASALDQFRATVAFDGGELETLYNRLNTAWERSQSKAEQVRQRIDRVRRVGTDLFEEWADELDAYERDDLRRRSSELLDDTRDRYQRMMAAMERAEASMDPVLQSFQDQVLFLKHNLNARAISALGGELDRIEDDTEALIAAMNEAISEADAFIQTLE